MSKLALPKLPTVAVVWDGNNLIHPADPPAVVDGYPNWLRVRCGCCWGLAWGGEEPRECNECGASAYYFVHVASGRGALWPGGPFNGWRYDPEDCAAWTARLRGVPHQTKEEEA